MIRNNSRVCNRVKLFGIGTQCLFQLGNRIRAEFYLPLWPICSSDIYVNQFEANVKDRMSVWHTVSSRLAVSSRVVTYRPTDRAENGLN